MPGPLAEVPETMVKVCWAGSKEHPDELLDEDGEVCSEEEDDEEDGGVCDEEEEGSIFSSEKTNSCG